MKKEHIRTVGKLLIIALSICAFWWKFEGHESWSAWLFYLPVFAFVGLAVFYIDYRRRQAAFNWPTVLATVQFCDDCLDSEGFYELQYSYPIEGEYYSASISVAKDRWVDDPCSMLKGASIQARVNPRNPEESVVEAASIPGMISTGRHDLIPCEL